MIAIVDYGVGNLFSLKSSLKMIGAEAVVTGDAAAIRACDKIILPGVGAFADAAAKLRATGLDQVVIEEARRGKPLLGICLGMQLLFEKSYEFEERKGLGLIEGYVDRITDPDLIIPHMGWNKLEINHQCKLFDGLGEDEYVYFVHSYKAFCDDKSLYSYCEYGSRVPAVVGDGKYVYGCQFHPEKSGKTGLTILKNFAELKA